MLRDLKKAIKRFSSMKLNKKIILSVVSITLIVDIFIIITISILAGNEITNKSSELIKGQFEMVNKLLVNKLEDFSDISLLISYDQRVKDYIMYNHDSKDNYLEITNDAYNLVRYSLDSNSNFIDYISLIKFNDSQLIYVGETWTNNDFREEILKSYNNAEQMNLYNFKISIDKKIFYKNKNVINIYTPIGSKYSEKDIIGFLVIGIAVDSLKDFYTSIEGEDNYHQFIINNNGVVISDKNNSNIGYIYYLYNDFIGNEGEVKTSKSIIVNINIINTSVI